MKPDGKKDIEELEPPQHDAPSSHHLCLNNALAVLVHLIWIAETHKNINTRTTINTETKEPQVHFNFSKVQWHHMIDFLKYLDQSNTMKYTN